MRRDYHALRDWRADFGTGIPILMYHKVMKAPVGTKKLRFLYLSPELFKRQIAELRTASFKGVSLQSALESQGDRKIVLSFDDAFRSIFENALEPIRQASFQSVTYVVADRIGGCNDWDRHLGDPLQPLMTNVELEAWLSAGQEIGSHTNSHPHLTRIPLADAREEILSSKKKLEDIFGVPVKHFCYPYGAYNETIRDLVQEAGYSSACTTVAGVNHAPVQPLELKRLTARYPSRKLGYYWKSFLSVLRFR